MSARFRIATTGLAVAVIGVLIADGLAVDSLRSKQQAERAAAARQAALDDFRSAVRPIAEAVYDQVQPLLDATTDTSALGDLGPDIRTDVFTRAGVDKALAAQVAALRRIRPPVPETRDAAELVKALDNLAATAARLGRVPTPQGVDSVEAAFQITQQLDVVVAYWASALVSTFGKRKVPATPSSEVGARRDALSRAAWVLGVDGACAQTADTLAFLAEDAEPALPAVTDIGISLREGVERVLQVKPPAADVATHERLVAAPLRDVRRFLDAALALAASAKNGGHTSTTQAQAVTQAGRRAFSRAAKGFTSRGATVCGRLFGSRLS